jgi:hypothetical protein
MITELGEMSFKLDGELIDVHAIYRWARGAGSGADIHTRAQLGSYFYNEVVLMNRDGIEHTDVDTVRRKWAALKAAGFMP